MVRVESATARIFLPSGVALTFTDESSLRQGAPFRVAAADGSATLGNFPNADLHGAVVIPHDVADKVMDAATAIARREAVIINAAKEPGFNVQKLREAQGNAAEIH